MTRLSDHTFTSSAPVFGADDDSFDPFFDTADRAAAPRLCRLWAAAEASPPRLSGGRTPVEFPDTLIAR